MEADIPKPTLETLLPELLRWKQDHLLAYWDELEPLAQQHLASQVQAIDFRQLQQQRQVAAKASAGKHPGDARAARAQSPPAVQLGVGDGRTPAEAARLRGEEALRSGKVGMILVAGGEGTRLGFDHPKGMFPIGPVSGRTLFEVLVDRLRAVARKYNTRIPLLVMTSPATSAETRRYFAEHDYLGLEAEDLRFFEQGTMPAVDAQTWKVLLADRGEVALAPDGHGGMLAALAKVIGFEELDRRGIELLFYAQIDNPLLPLCDPEFLGYHLLRESEMTTMVVRKHDPAERVGVIAEVDGRLEIIEYSDLSPEAAATRQKDGSLLLWAGNTAIHAFDVAFLRRVSGLADGLPWHLAHKKVPHLDAQGNLVEPAEPNAIKFERFIFDLLPQAKNALVVEVERAEAFAPVKNSSEAQADTPRTAQAAMCALHAEWLRQAGAEIQEGARVEINPLWALDASEVAARIEPGLKVEQDTYFA